MADYEVAQAGIYRRVNGKLQALKVGERVKLTDDQADRMQKRGFVRAVEPEMKKRKPHLKMPEPMVVEMMEPETTASDDYHEDDSAPEPELKKEKPKKATKKRRLKK